MAGDPPHARPFPLQEGGEPPGKESSGMPVWLEIDSGGSRAILAGEFVLKAMRRIPGVSAVWFVMSKAAFLTGCFSQKGPSLVDNSRDISTLTEGILFDQNSRKYFGFHTNET